MGGRASESRGSVVPIERIGSRILLVRGHKVLLDADLAALYGVTTKRFNEQVRRNAARFPEDFIFRLSAEEWDSLRSQSATLKTGRGQHRKYLPLAFTEHGASGFLSAPTINASARRARLQRLHEVLGRDARLLEDTGERAGFQLAVIGHDAPVRAATHHDVAAALTRDRKAQAFQGAHHLRPGDAGQLRHARRSGMS